MDVKELYIHASDEFDKRVGLIEPHHWSDPTPNTDWTVRDLVNHLTNENLWVPELLAGKTISEVGNRFDGDVLGNDPLQSWQNAATAAKEAAEKVDPDSLVHLSYGEVPAGEYLDQMFIDQLIHAWDLARAIKADEQLDAELVQTCYEQMLDQAEDWRQAGAFAAAVTVPDDADIQTKLLALTGRDAKKSI